MATSDSNVGAAIPARDLQHFTTRKIAYKELSFVVQWKQIHCITNVRSKYFLCNAQKIFGRTFVIQRMFPSQALLGLAANLLGRRVRRAVEPQPKGLTDPRTYRGGVTTRMNVPKRGAPRGRQWCITESLIGHAVGGTVVEGHEGLLCNQEGPLRRKAADPSSLYSG